ncbi:MAG: DUF4145 domain-containing protein [Longimicrobiaceae bacterium]
MYEGQELYEHFDGKRFNEAFEYLLYQCPTCQGVSLFGDFSEYARHASLEEKRLYPRGSQLLPKGHKLGQILTVPKKIVEVYEEIWPLRHLAPNAFAGQIRRALEFICRDQNAQGRNLFEQLKDLVSRGTFPGYFSEITDLMRKVGNLGAHGGEQEVDYWDAELLDDFFRYVVEYVYVAPAKIERLRQRVGH